MKSVFLSLGLFLVFVSCGESNNQSHHITHEEVDNPTEVSGLAELGTTELEQQIQLHGREILNAYYCLSSKDFRARIDQAMGFSMMNDLQYTVRHEPEALNLNFILGELEEELNKLPEKARSSLTKKAVLWLNISKVVSGRFCGVDGESFWEALYEIPELQGFIDAHIDPKLGQSVHSLASGQAAEIEVEIWNYLTEVNREDRLRIIGKLMGECGELEF